MAIFGWRMVCLPRHVVGKIHAFVQPENQCYETSFDGYNREVIVSVWHINSFESNVVPGAIHHDYVVCVDNDVKRRFSNKEEALEYFNTSIGYVHKHENTNSCEDENGH